MSKDLSDETVVTHIGQLEGIQQKKPAIHILGGPAMGQQILLEEGESTWGRSAEANVVIRDEAISRLHFRIRVRDRVAVIEDLGSTNGTFVNGMRIKSHILEPNDKIQISSLTVLRFSYVDPIDSDVHQRFYEMALFDPVTQAHTKRYFNDRIGHEFAHSQRRAIPLSLVLFDLDHFKKVNDTFGHPAGDYVLQQISQLTKKLIRKEDLFARYGGEEFVLLMRDTPKDSAAKLAERLRVSIEKATMNFEGKSIPVTVSLGLACFDGKNFKTPSELVKQADLALYESKSKGRNQVSVK